MTTINEMIDFCEDLAAYDCFSNEQFARREMFYAIADELKKLHQGKNTLFISLDNAVKVCKYRLECEHDEEIIRNELEKACYLSNEQYSIGYYDALKEAQKAIERLQQ